MDGAETIGLIISLIIVLDSPLQSRCNFNSELNLYTKIDLKLHQICRAKSAPPDPESFSMIDYSILLRIVIAISLSSAPYSVIVCIEPLDGWRRTTDIRFRRDSVDVG